MTQEHYWMKLALEEAERALEEREVPVGAIVVKEGLILGKGHNRNRALADPTAHAEMLALTAAAQALGSDRLDGCWLFTTLEPCPMCAGALILARVERLYYAAPDPRMGACGSLFDLLRDPRLSHQVEVYHLPNSTPQSLELLRRFFFSLRRDRSLEE